MRLPGLLRTGALVVAVVGALGSEAFMLRAGRNTPRLLLVVFVFWVLSPFVALVWANKVSPHWPALTRATLHGVTFILTLGSLALYGGLIPRPPGAPNAFYFVLVAPASGLLLAIAVGIATLISRAQSRRGAGR